MFITAIILAAGESKRMGQSKLLLKWGRKSLLEQTLDYCRFHQPVPRLTPENLDPDCHSYY